MLELQRAAFADLRPAMEYSARAGLQLRGLRAPASEVDAVAPGRRGAAAEPGLGERIADAARGGRRQVGVDDVAEVHGALGVDLDLGLDVGAGEANRGAP